MIVGPHFVTYDGNATYYATNNVAADQVAPLSFPIEQWMENGEVVGLDPMRPC